MSGFTEEVWGNCYESGWKTYLTDAAFAHPAKFACGLVERIFAEMLARGMLKKGDVVVDPFGGVGCGGIVAASNGLQWFGCELEEKFVKLAQENFALHRRTWEEFSDPLPVIVQGDSRKLRENLAAVLPQAVVSSPPYQGDSGKSDRTGHERAERRADEKGFRQGLGCFKTSEAYGETPGQLGAMSAGNVEAVVSSPPFLGARSGTEASVETRGGGPCAERLHTIADGNRLGTTEGQLSDMQPGQIAAVISSPPYSECLRGDNSAKETAEESRAKRITQGGSLGQSARHQGYGGPDNLGNLPAGEVDSVVGSPPYEGSLDQGTVDRNERREFARGAGISNAEHVSPIDMERIGKRSQPDYGATEGQLGAQQAETFWFAAAEIVRECFAILKPGGWAVFVCKDFIRDKQRVPFSDDWRKLCEHSGFELKIWVKASLLKEDRSPGLFDGEDVVKTKARKSFFRRLYEKKYPENSIDEEDVLFFWKPETTSPNTSAP